MGQEAACLGNCVGCEYVNVGLCQENRGEGEGTGQRAKGSRVHPDLPLLMCWDTSTQNKNDSTGQRKMTN